MNTTKLKHVTERLEYLDERLTHRVRPRQPANMGRLTSQLMEERVKDLSHYAVELKEIVRELVESLEAAR